MKRILHIVGGMNRGGVETWLMQVLRHIDRDQFQMDFLVHTEQPCAYDNEIRVLGSQIIPCMHPSQPLRYARNFRQILRTCGPYDVLHSHVHHYSGYTLWLAKQAGVPVRIAHSHNDTSAVQAQASFLRKGYLYIMATGIDRYATIKLAASKEAGQALFGNKDSHANPWQTLYYGIDLERFKVNVDRLQVRAEFGIPDGAIVVGHVGRFAEQKNHRFLVEIAKAACEQDPNIYFLLVGDGPLRAEIQEQVERAGLSERVIFAGLRDDIPRLML
ncbi:MAG: glycosyltransferase, partial [Anaerolineae bacterium]|nr:glycosyltransferase [Anaerolineae bacterium]